MQQRLIHVMDPMCSWCWGMAPLLDRIRQRWPDLPLHLMPASLRANHGAPLDQHSRQALAAHWQAVASLSGQPFGDPQALPPTLVYDTRPASRALVAARELDAERSWVFARALQQAFYVQTQDLTQTAVLVAVAEQAGYPADTFAERFDAASCAEQLDQDLLWVEGLGLAELPILFGERDGQLALLSTGYRPETDVLALLERWLAAGESRQSVA
ncbi:DsbA family protein [Pseudomonas abyssi]|uniref:DsbA family protein n=1 Tax=Pseudomonas abyssi TaxID=170540 RepID=UPI003C7BB149